MQTAPKDRPTALLGSLPALLAWATLLACAASCALSAPPIDDVLDAASAPSDKPLANAIAHFRANRADVAAALAAARALFAAADVEVQRALADASESIDADSPSDVLAAEESLPDVILERILGLANSGAEAAQAAIEQLATDTAGHERHGQEVEANVLLAQHLSFVGWANGPVRSLMSGLGNRIQTAMARAIELDPEWCHGAPLRLKGRFLAKAPWPLRDRDESLQLLQRAAQLRAMPIHHLFLGDILFEQGDLENAIVQWRMVQTATPDETTADTTADHRRMAASRLRAAAK
ncbi:MAG: hypothetical protein AB8H80_10210 [Planctomycetota bacterium]